MTNCISITHFQVFVMCISDLDFLFKNRLKYSTFIFCLKPHFCPKVQEKTFLNLTFII